MSSVAEHATRPGLSRARPRAVPSAHRRVLIRDAYGLHLRLADRIVHLAERFRAEIQVSHRGRAADGRSILDMLGLGAACGTRLDLEARGPDAERAVAALTDLIATWASEDPVA
jgi:phosphocarrier protein HPr